jgi:hypothetical protein
MRFRRPCEPALKCGRCCQIKNEWEGSLGLYNHWQLVRESDHPLPKKRMAGSIALTDPIVQASVEQAQLRGARARAHRDNHYLPFRTGVATPVQVAATEQALAVLLRHLQDSRSKQRLARAGLTVRLMLDLGRNAGQLAKLYRLHCVAGENVPPLGQGLVSWQDTGVIKFGWWLSAGVHIDRTQAARGTRMRGKVWLPILQRTEPWLALNGLISDINCRPLMASNPEEVKRDFSLFRAWARKTLGPLADSVPRYDNLSGVLIERLAWHPTGDRTLAKHVSGRDLEHSYARSYYTCLPVPKAAQLYAKAMPDTISHLSLANSSEGADEIAIATFAHKALTRQEPKGSVELMRVALERLGNEPVRPQNNASFIDAHNTLVMKLWIVLAFSIAGRRRSAWVPGWKRVEPRTGGLLVLDKKRNPDAQDDPERTDNSAPSRVRQDGARLVFLHPNARNLLGKYIDQLHALLELPSLAEDSRVLVEWHVHELVGDALLPPLVLETEHDKIVANPVGPKWFENEQKGRTDVPANFARHALRSGLLGHVPHSAIDALLGHSDRGTEPWSNGSALDPCAYRALLMVIFEANFADATLSDDKQTQTHKKRFNGRQS